MLAAAQGLRALKTIYSGNTVIFPKGQKRQKTKALRAERPPSALASCTSSRLSWLENYPTRETRLCVKKWKCSGVPEPRGGSCRETPPLIPTEVEDEEEGKRGGKLGVSG